MRTVRPWVEWMQPTISVYEGSQLMITASILKRVEMVSSKIPGLDTI